MRREYNDMTFQDNNSRLSLPSVERMIRGLDPLQQKVVLTSVQEEIVVTVACDSIAGGVVENTVRTLCPASKFPTVDRGNTSGRSASRVNEVLRHQMDSSSDSASNSEDDYPLAMRSHVGQTKRVESARIEPRRMPNESRILQELQQVDWCVNREQVEHHELLGKQQRMLPLSGTVKAGKTKRRAYKTKEEKQKEAENAKKEEESMLARLQRCSERNRAEQIAAQEERKKKREREAGSTGGEQEMRQEEAKMSIANPSESQIERKKFKPEDWNCRVGEMDGDDDELQDVTASNEGTNIARHPYQKMESGSGERLHASTTHQVTPSKPKQFFVVIDSDSDCDAQSPKGAEGRSEDGQSEEYWALCNNEEALQVDVASCDEARQDSCMGDRPLDSGEATEHEVMKAYDVSYPVQGDDMLEPPTARLPSSMASSGLCFHLDCMSTGGCQDPQTGLTAQNVLQGAPEGPGQGGLPRSGQLTPPEDKFLPELHSEDGELDSDYLERLLTHFD